MRIRGVLRWTAGAALLPLAIAAVVLLAMNCDVLLRQGTWQFIGGSGPADLQVDCADMTPDQAFILHGDPTAHGRAERAKSISDRWPDNPVYFGNYAISQLSAWGVDPSAHLAERADLAGQGRTS